MSTGTMFDKWINIFQTAFVLPQPFDIETITFDLHEIEYRANLPLSKMKSSVLEIFYVIFRNYANPKLKSKSHFKFCTFAKEKYAMMIFNLSINILKFALTNFVSPKLIIGSFKILQEALTNPYTIEDIKNILPELLTQAAFNFVILPNTFINSWGYRQLELIQYMYEDDLSGKEVRTEVMEFIKTACKCKRFDQGPKKPRVNQPFLNHFMTFLELTLHESLQANDILRFEASLYALGKLRRPLKKYIDQINRIEPLLIAYVLPGLESSIWLVRLRCCWMYSKYSSIYLKDHEKAIEAAGKLYKCFDDECLSVKVTAAIALSYLCEKPYIENQSRIIIIELISGFMWMMTQTEINKLVNALKRLIRSFDKAIIPYSVGVIKELIEAYKRMNKNDIEQSKELFYFSEAEIASSTCLNTITQIITIIKNEQDILLAIESLIESEVELIMGTTKYNFLDNAMELLSYLTLYQNPISDNLWKWIPRLMDIIIGTPKEEEKARVRKNGGKGYDSLRELIPFFQNIIVKSPDKFATGKFEYGEYVTSMIRFIIIVLEIATFHNIELEKIPVIQLIISMLEGLTVILLIIIREE